MRTTLPILLAALALPAGTASAAELTYVDRDNVWIENVDGSARHALTADGTPARPYALPTADGAGNLAAFQPDASGQQQIVYWAGGAGEPVRHQMPRAPGDTTTGAPTSARMQPDAASPTLGYTFLAFGDPVLPRYGRVAPSFPSRAGAEAAVDYVDLTWHRERPVVARSDGAVYWTGLTRPLLTANEPGTTLTFAEISEDGTRILVRMRDAAGAQRLALFAYEGQIGFGEVTSGCAIPVGAGFTRGALSRDGRLVAWDDGGGVHVAAAEPDRFDGDSTCLLQAARTVSASARMPAFSAASTTLPPAADPPAPPPTSTPPVVTPSFQLTVPKRLKASALRKGVAVTTVAPAAGRVTLTLRRGSRTVASGSATVKRAGAVKIRLRLKRGAKRVAGKATLIARFAPKSGAAVTRRAALRVG